MRTRTDRCSIVRRRKPRSISSAMAFVAWISGIDGELIGLQWHFDTPLTSGTPRDVVTGIDQEPVQPGVEPVRIPQGRQVEPGIDQRVLDRILGPAIVANDEPRNGVESADRRRREHGEGVAIACSSPDDDVPIHLTT